LPTLRDVLYQLQFITRELAVLGLFITAGLIALVRDWRVSLLALLGQYVVTGYILSRLVLPELALIKILIGALICPMLYLAARQSGWNLLSSQRATGRSIRAGHGDSTGNYVFRVNLAFRVLAATLMLMLAVVLNQTYPLPMIPPDVGLGCYWLILIGILILMLTEEPLKGGLGLLTLLTGFDLLYAPLERSLVVAWLWAVVSLLLALAIAFLAVAKGVGTVEEDL
jgi:hypothetical protein